MASCTMVKDGTMRSICQRETMSRAKSSCPEMTTTEDCSIPASAYLYFLHLCQDFFRFIHGGKHPFCGGSQIHGRVDIVHVFRFCNFFLYQRRLGVAQG